MPADRMQHWGAPSVPPVELGRQLAPRMAVSEWLAVERGAPILDNAIRPDRDDAVIRKSTNEDGWPVTGKTATTIDVLEQDLWPCVGDGKLTIR